MSTGVGRIDAAQDLNPLDELSRQKWSNCIAAILSQMNINVIHLIVEAGEQRFLSTSGWILDRHKLKTEDLKYIFAVLVKTSRMNRKYRPGVVLNGRGR